MANIIKLVAGQAFTSAGFTAADFNSLANGSFVLASTAIDNSTNLDLFAELSGQVEVGGTTTATSYFGLWLLPRNRDGSTYGDGTPSGTTLPNTGYLVTVIGPRIGITSGNACFYTFPRVLIPRGLFKWGLSNHNGAALDSTAAAAWEFWTTNLNTNG
jgi:hypothetical protein